ncbi:MAG: hypothetical protein LC104_20655 [Bacteroidales bacterium]|nr:hypothetical protein [Bacteroidales bacterium]
MNRTVAPLVALLVVAGTVRADVPTVFDDAPLRAVRFVDARVGWAVGDQGVVWQSIDSGKTWERLRLGSRASFRSICFLTPYTGWIAGRVESPTGVGSTGVVFTTVDGGVTWKQLTTGALPGLNFVKFFDENRGIVAGDGTDTFPTGVFATTDGGKSWTPIAGPRATTWLGGEFTNFSNGMLTGAWSRVMLVRDGQLKPAELDPLDGRSVRGITSDGTRAVAVAEGGRILTSRTNGTKWGFANLPLSSEALAVLDFRCVAAAGNHVWVAGAPGSVVLHSPDFGQSWDVQKTTGHTTPINSVFMLDAQTGWAVGELGTILGTTNGGKTWTTLKCGGQRAAALFTHAHMGTVPLGVLAAVGGKEGYLAAMLAVTTADPASANPERAADLFRLETAMRNAGGVAAETAYGFPIPDHARDLPPAEFAKVWAKLDTTPAHDRLTRRLVLALRTWQPEVLISDPYPLSDDPAERLILTAAQDAFKKAADPAVFPEQIQELGLQPHAAKKLYALTANAADAPVKYDLSAFVPGLGDTLRDCVESAVGLLPGGTNPALQSFRLISHRLPGSGGHMELMDGTGLAEGGTARRPKREISPALAGLLADREKAARTRRQLEQMLTQDLMGGNAERALTQTAATLGGMPDDMAARAAVGMGKSLAASGRWTAARELFAFAADRYPAHPETADALLWLARFYSSSEVRRRLELGHHAIYQKTAFVPTGGETVKQATHIEPVITAQAVFQFSGPNAAQAWNRACLELQPKLAAFGPGVLRDPATNLCLLAARRQLGLYGDAAEVAKALVTAGGDTASTDPWQACLASELWIGNQASLPMRPKPLARAAFTTMRPFLDGKLDDSCWSAYEPLKLTGPGSNGYSTTARFAFDDKFFYVAVTCQHPEGKQQPKAEKRSYDADLRGRDRVDILLDLDRDYQTAYRLQIDQRGCVAEDCWGDRSWNPKWYVAVEPTPTGWTAEVAIPLSELTGATPSQGNVWAANVVRVVPGVGVQSWSSPAGNSPRPEGMGLLQFHVK